MFDLEYAKKFGYDPIIRDIPDYEELYQISENGEVYNKITGKELIGGIDNHGYRRISVRKNNKKKSLQIHIILAKLFVKNIKKYSIVDHIDRNRENNSLENLRYVDYSQNATNKNILKNNISGYVGVNKYNDRRNGIFREHWRAYITKNKVFYTSLFPYTDEGLQKAIEWRKQKEIELHTYD